MLSPGLKINNEYLSRIHFTLYYDRRAKKWLLIDGGLYEDDPLPTPSRNGIWICSDFTTQGEWMRINGKIELHPHDRILLAPDLRLIVCEDCHMTTQGGFLWEDQFWKFTAAYEQAKRPKLGTAIEQDLIRERPDKPTLYYLLLDWGDYFQAAPSSFSEGLWKTGLIGFLLTVALLALSGLWIWVGGPQLILHPPGTEQAE